MDIKLIAQCGPAKGQAVEVRSPKFFIGSNSSCQLRPEMPALGGVHALIEQRNGQVFVRDFGAEGGTTVNDRVLRSRESEVFDGDRLRVGPLDLTFSISSHRTDTPAMSVAPAGWPFVAGAAAPASPVVPRAAPAPGVSAQPSAQAVVDRVAEFGALKYEAVGEVLLVTLLSTDLFDEDTVSPVRFELQTLLEQPLSRQVVINLENVAYMSSRAVGVILAHYQGVTREGGTVRVCCIHPKVMPVLQQMRLNMVIDLFDTVDEAVQTPWEE